MHSNRQVRQDTIASQIAYAPMVVALPGVTSGLASAITIVNDISARLRAKSLIYQWLSLYSAARAD